MQAFVSQNIKEDDKFYYILCVDLNKRKTRKEIEQYLLSNGWVYVYNCKSKNLLIKGRRCYRISKNDYQKQYLNNIEEFNTKPIESTIENNDENDFLSQFGEDDGNDFFGEFNDDDEMFKI